MRSPPFATVAGCLSADAELSDGFRIPSRSIICHAEERTRKGSGKRRLQFLRQGQDFVGTDRWRRRQQQKPQSFGFSVLSLDGFPTDFLVGGMIFQH